MSFPKDWPPGCPDSSIPDADLRVFRLVKSDPVSEFDMRSHHETGRLRNANPCLRCGLSVFQTVEDAQSQFGLMPRLGGKIAEGEIKPSHGKACLTSGSQPTHTTWWPREGVNRTALFAVIMEVPLCGT